MATQRLFEKSSPDAGLFADPPEPAMRIEVIEPSRIGARATGRQLGTTNRAPRQEIPGPKSSGRNPVPPEKPPAVNMSAFARPTASTTPVSTAGCLPGLVLGEPVDTSFARPEQTPAV